MGYSGHYDEESMARAYGKEIKISPKHSVEICRAIRGMWVPDAVELLELVIEKKKAITFRRYNKCVPHQKTSSGGGRYPVKASTHILKVLEGAMANAAFKELDPDEMKIATAAASRGRVLPGWIQRAHGRSTKFDEETTNIEIILESLED